MEVEISDEALVERYRQTREVSSFTVLMRRYQLRIYNACYRMLGNKEEAEDIVQDTFMKIHQGIDGFRNEATVSAWVFRIAHNLSIDHLRTRGRKKREIAIIPLLNLRSIFDGESVISEVQEVADLSLEPGRKLDLKEESAVLEASLAEIPETQRAVLILHDIEGLNYQDIAEIVGTSIGTVRSRLHYGRIKLKELLEPYYTQRDQAITPR